MVEEREIGVPVALRVVQRRDGLIWGFKNGEAQMLKGKVDME